MAEELKKLSAEEHEALREKLKAEAAQAAAQKSEKTIESSVDDNQESQSGKNVSVTIAEDNMSASVTLSVPNPGERYTVPDVVGALRRCRVVLGIQTMNIMEMVSEEIYEDPMVVALGKEAEKGEDGYYEFLVDLSEHKTPEIREDGTCDYSAMGRLPNVAEGELIAVYHPAVQGVKGYNVVGMELLPKLAKDQTPLRGKYISFDQETLEYRATVAGKISCSNNNVEILTVHEVNNDLDMATGDVEFYGDIIINGNVEAGVTVRAGRNVTIQGTVSSAKIFAGGDIILAKGMQGNNKGKISARGDVYAEFIEYATVEAGGDISVNSLINCNVSANGTVSADGKRGMIIGGYTHGLKGITFRTSGNNAELRTDLHSGFKPEDYKKYVDLVKQGKDLKDKINEIVEEMSDLLKAGKKVGVTKSQKEKILGLSDKKNEIYKEIEDIEESKKFLVAEMAKGANASIVCKGMVHANTYICIDAAILHIMQDENYLKYICRNEIIERRTVSIGS